MTNDGVQPFFANGTISISPSLEFIHDEEIGNLSFASGYVPLYNNHDELLAYLNLPYF